MFAKEKLTPDKNKQNSLCIDILIIFLRGTFVQLKLERFKKSSFLLSHL